MCHSRMLRQRPEALLFKSPLQPHYMHVLPRKNMFSCPNCAISQFPTLRKLLRHIRLSHSDQENFRIACNLQGCSRTFQSLRTFENHVYAYHDVNSVTSTQTEVDQPLNATAVDDEYDQPQTPESEESEQIKGLHINDNNNMHQIHQCNR